MRRIIIFWMLAIITAPVTFTFAEEMVITTYYPSPNGTYDALNAKRLSVGDTNGDGNINASDVPASSGYLLVADKVGIGTASPGNNKLYVAANNLQGIRVASAADANLGIGLIKGTGDGASITTYNGALESWYGIAFRSSLDGGVRYTFDTRTGNTYIAGNVGIGTTAPNHLLQLTKSHNSGTTADMFRVNFDDNWGLRLRQNYTGAGNIQYDLIERHSSVDYNVLTFKGGNVGIGTTSPQGRLDIAGGGIFNVRSIYALADGTSNIDLLYQQDNDLYIKSRATSGKVFIGAGGDVPLCVFGNVGIGTMSPAGKLDINAVDGVWIMGYSVLSHINNGSTFLKASGGNYICFQIPNGTTVSTINSAGSYSVSSDRRLKTNIRPFTPNDGLAAILRLDPVRFNWKSADVTKTSQMGFVAQDIQKVFPQLVTDMGVVTIKLADGTTQTVRDVKGLSYEGLIAPMVKAIQEQQKQIDELREELRVIKIRSASRSK